MKLSSMKGSQTTDFVFGQLVSTTIKIDTALFADDDGAVQTDAVDPVKRMGPFCYWECQHRANVAYEPL